jgi:hypothetical protein
MKKYTVSFSLYGKNMKTTVFADDPEKAKESIRKTIAFHKIEEDKKPCPITNYFKKIGLFKMAN